MQTWIAFLNTSNIVIFKTTWHLKQQWKYLRSLEINLTKIVQTLLGEIIKLFGKTLKKTEIVKFIRYTYRNTQYQDLILTNLIYRFSTFQTNEQKPKNKTNLNRILRDTCKIFSKMCIVEQKAKNRQ